MALEKGLLVAQICEPQCDPAFDRTHPEWKVLVGRYVETRAPADLAKLPLVEGRKPRLYEIACVTPAQYGVIRGAKDFQRVTFACLMGVTGTTDPRTGEVERPALVPGRDGTPAATDAWLRQLQRHGGMRLLEELQAVVICRADAGDWEEAEGADPLGLYELPAGWMPGRSKPPAPSAAAAPSTTSVPPQ